MRAFCHTRNSIRYALSRAPNDVKNSFSLSVHTRIALGITKAVFSLVIAVTSFHRRDTCFQKVVNVEFFNSSLSVKQHRLTYSTQRYILVSTLAEVYLTRC